MISSNKIIFYGGVGATTGANIMLQVGGASHRLNILVDCGILQGVDNASKINSEPFAFKPSEVVFLFLTHAHMDHIGRVPKLVRDGFLGQIISTPETRELARPLLEDALKVMQSNDPEHILYDSNDIAKTFTLWETKKYDEEFKIFEEASAVFQNAGHILGSAIVNIKIGDKKYAFTGDLGNSPSPLLPDTDLIKKADAIVMESVYGDRNHEAHEIRDANLLRVLKEGIARGGAILVPAFSVERTQVLLYEINNYIEEGKLPSVPVFVDSPLAAKVTDIYKKYSDNFNESVRAEIRAGDDIFNFPKLEITRSVLDSKSIYNKTGPKIIIAGSGMSEGGRVVSHEANLLPHAENTLLLVGYQSVGTLGRRLEEGEKEVNINHQKIKVRARVEVIKGFSSHKDSDHLLEFVEKSVYGENWDGKNTAEVKKPKIFVIMGEPKASLFLAQRIKEYLDIEAIFPEAGKEYPI